MSATMFRTTAARSIPRSFMPLPRASFYNHVLKASLRTSTRPANASRVLSLTVCQPLQKSLVRYKTNMAYQYDTKKAEEELGKTLLQPVPSAVTTASSVRPVKGEVGAHEEEDEVDMMATIRSDFVCRTSLNSFPVTDVGTEHNQGHIQLAGCSSRGALCWLGWCHSIPRYISHNSLSLL